MKAKKRKLKKLPIFILLLIILLVVVGILFILKHTKYVTNDKKVENTAHFRYLLYKHHIGDKLKVTYNRNGKEQMTEVVLNKKIS